MFVFPAVVSRVDVVMVRYRQQWITMG